MWLRVPDDVEVADVHVRTVVDGEPTFVPATVDAGAPTAPTRGGGPAALPQPGHELPLPATGGPTGYAWLNGAGLHLRDVPDAGDFRLVAHAIHRRPGRWTPSSTRSSPTGSPRPLGGGCGRAEVPDWAIPARWDGPRLPFAVRDQGAASSTAATSTGSPSTSTISTARRPTSSTSPRSSRPGPTTATTRPPSARSTRARAATRRCAGSPPRPTDAVCGSSATSRRTTPATRHEWFRRRAAAATAARAGLLLLDRRDGLRRLARREVAAQAQLRQRRAAASVLRRPGRASRGGSVAAGAWTAGGSTSPT